MLAVGSGGEQQIRSSSYGTLLSRSAYGRQLNFVDFEKTKDSVHRESLWAIMAKYGIPEKIVKMVRVFYGDFKCAVEDQGEVYEWFDIKTGVKQRCNMSGFLFLIVMNWVMGRAVGGGKNGITVDGSLLQNWMTWTLRTMYSCFHIPSNSFRIKRQG